MAIFNRAIPVLSISASLFGTAASADLAADDLWTMWKEYMTSFGYEVTATEDTSDGMLVVKDITANAVWAEGSGTARTTISELTYKENGDGTVSLICPDVITITSHSETRLLPEDMAEAGQENSGASDAPASDTPTTEAPKEAENDGGQTQEGDTQIIDISLEVMCSDMTMVASGTANELAFKYSGPSMAVKLLDFDMPGGDADIEQMEVTLTGLEGHDVYKIGGAFAAKTGLTAKEVIYAVHMVPGPEQKDVSLVSTLTDVSLKSNSNNATGSDANVSDGMASADMDGTFEYAREASEFKSSEPFAGTSKSSLGKLNFTIKDGVLAFGVKAQDIDVSVTEGVPLPLQVTMQEFGINHTLPITPGDEVKDFSLGMSIRELVVPDLLWGLFDPGQKLPRDPLTFVLDLSGKGKLSIDFTDPEEITKVDKGEKQFGELEEIKLDTLNVDALGAALTGTGALSFDNSKADGDLPAPEGAIDLKMVGSTALINNLIEAGLMPQEKAMGLRMMLGLFTVAGADGDTLMSKIEFLSDGQIMANGQRIK